MKRPILNAKRLSQAYQEFFAYSIGGGRDKSYIEIGAYRPRHRSNTYSLEVLEGWKGFSLEYNVKHKLGWDECVERKNPIYWADAMTFDYRSHLKNLKLPNRITYLSCDIEPPNHTFKALQQVIEQGVEFDCITFEHDNSNLKSKKHAPEDYNIIATEYLLTKGYKVAVYDVYCNEPTYLFETWFVKNDIDFTPVSFENWKKTLGNTL
jgi:hypothetical protein